MKRTVSGVVIKPMLMGIEVRVPAAARAFAALAGELSPDGVFVATFHELAPGTEVTVELALADGPLRAEGRVAEAAVSDSRGSRTGLLIRFDAMSPSDRARLLLVGAPRAANG